MGSGPSVDKTKEILISQFIPRFSITGSGPSVDGNIIVEAKAIEKLSNHERSQLFGYMLGTGYPIGLLVL